MALKEWYSGLGEERVLLVPGMLGWFASGLNLTGSLLGSIDAQVDPQKRQRQSVGQGLPNQLAYLIWGALSPGTKGSASELGLTRRI